MPLITLQLHHHGAWHDAATIEIAEIQAGIRSPTVVDYKMDYVAEWDPEGLVTEQHAVDCRSISVNYPVNFIAWPVATWPAFLLDLLPQGQARINLISRLNLNANDPAIEYELLLRGASTPIGNLRLRESWRQELTRIRNQEVPGLSQEDLYQTNEKLLDVLGRFALIASGSSGVQGEWPKMLLTKARDGLWYPDSVVEDKDAQDHIILKLARGDRDNAYKEILEAEGPYLEVARAFGLRVGRPLYMPQDCLIIPRFDREIVDREVVRHGQESLVSAIGKAEFGYMGHHEDYIAAIKQFSTRPKEDLKEYLLRDLLNFAMGNPDNHGRNTALQKSASADEEGEVYLTPLFDFTPMRLHPEGIARSTRWASLNGQDMNPNWQKIIEATAGDESLVTIDELRQEIKSKLHFLKDLPSIAEDLGVSSRVIAAACARHRDAYTSLKAL
jgi:serine/threonine-protein kinase HipA